MTTTRVLLTAALLPLLCMMFAAIPMVSGTIESTANSEAWLAAENSNFRYAEEGSVITNDLLEITVRDDYTNATVTGAMVSLLHQGVVIGSALTCNEGIALLAVPTDATDTPEIPSEFALSENYPNPFMSDTRVDLALPHEQTLAVSVYNVLGQRVITRQLLIPAGYHTLDLSLGHLATGTYFLRVTGRASGTVKLFKMGGTLQGMVPGPSLSVSPGRMPDLQQGAVPVRPSAGKLSADEYILKVETDRYDTFESAFSLSELRNLAVPLSRNNEIEFIVTDQQNQPLTLLLNVDGGSGSFTVMAPGTLWLKSGRYSLTGQTQTHVIDDQIEVVSRDTTLSITAFPVDDDQEKKVTGSELIAEALRRGEIDYETSLIYRAFSIFGDPRLPLNFHGTVRSIADATSLFLEIHRQGERISGETLEALAPFMARPNDPVSIFSSGPIREKGLFRDDQNIAPADKELAYPDRDGRVLFDTVDTWVSVPAAGGLARAWVPSIDGEEAASRELATSLAGAIDEVWPLLFGPNALLKQPLADVPGSPSKDINPDGAIDVFFVDFQTIDSRMDGCLDNPAGNFCTLSGGLGIANPVAPRVGNTRSGYAVIDIWHAAHANTGGTGVAVTDALIGTLAHELYHIGQFGYNVFETAWLMESTATWAEFTVLRNLGRSADEVRAFLPDFFESTHRQLTDTIPPDLPYATYLYPLFVEMEQGQGTMGKVWARSASLGVQGERHFDNYLPFRDNFREFALRNWNADPVEPLYVTIDPGFPAGLQPEIAEEWTMNMEETITVSGELVLLSARYDRITVTLDEDAVQLLYIDLSKVTGNPDAGVDAIVTIEGRDPEVRNWSDRSEVKFCLDIEDERVEEIILIVSNASMDSPLSSVIEIDTEEVCPAFVGTVTYNHTVEGSYVRSDGRLEELSRQTNVVMDIVLDYHEDYSSSANNFVATSGRVRWSHNNSTITHNVYCGSVGKDEYGIQETRVTGGGSYPVSEGVNLVSMWWRTGQWLQPDQDRYVMSVGHTTVGLGTGPDYQYKSQTFLCDVPGSESWFHLTFYINETIISEIIDEDRLMDGWRHERLHYDGSVSEVRTLDWDLRRYTDK